LRQIATLGEAEEDSIIWRKNHLPIVTVRADVPDEVSAPEVSMSIDR